MATIAGAPVSQPALASTAPGPLVTIIEATELRLTAKVLDNLGRSTVYGTDFPTTNNFEEMTPLQQAFLLKNGSWEKFSIPMILFAICYAKKLGLDIMQGDVYATGEGRIATSNVAKIKLAYRTGLIEDAPQVDTRELDTEVPGTGLTDLETTVRVQIKGWKSPIVKTQRLSEWFVPKNPNWTSRPAHMLELNTLAHALTIINPSAETGPDEAPPTVALPTTPISTDALVAAQFAEAASGKAS